MARPKGQPKVGGRQKGTPNKVNAEFRETVRQLLEDNAENVAKWLDMVANGHGDQKPDPGKALEHVARLAEFAAPKLARTEITGKNGTDLIPPQFIIRPVEPK